MMGNQSNHTAFTAENLTAYKVGGLLYTPATQSGIAEKITRGVYPCVTSIALCLEDSIQDAALSQAEQQVKQTLADFAAQSSNWERSPMLFLRIRTPQHMAYMHEFLDDREELLTGYILPKFDLSNAKIYVDLIRSWNQNRAKRLYMMPVLESRMIANIESRKRTLLMLKHILDDAKELVLNVRVGGNDFCNLYGLRRRVGQNIYQIGVIRDILTEIINVFATDYVVSGPVWEYFGSNEKEAWAEGLRRELEEDSLNGFTGKTAIHPSQLPLIYESMKPRRSDYQDAMQILNWSPDVLAVQRSWNGSRMNEVKCHLKWASRVAVLGEIYGIREE